MIRPHTEEVLAGTAAAEQGVVMLDGPDGVAVTMTPEAAEQTADSLRRAADEARAQSIGPGG